VHDEIQLPSSSAAKLRAPDCFVDAPRNQNMPLLNVVVVLVIVGVVLYLINRYIPMASSIKSILNIVVVVAVCVWILQVTGLWSGLGSFRLKG
jgi:hypothetical protein